MRGAKRHRYLRVVDLFRADELFRLLGVEVVLGADVDLGAEAGSVKTDLISTTTSPVSLL